MKRYIVVMRNGDGAFKAQRLQAIADTLERMSADGAKLVFSEGASEVAGFTLKTDRVARQIRSAMEPYTNVNTRGFVLVFEMGEDFDAIGNSAGWRHLQH